MATAPPDPAAPAAGPGGGPGGGAGDRLRDRLGLTGAVAPAITIVVGSGALGLCGIAHHRWAMPHSSPGRRPPP